jgi:Fur family ferric uptake transcriptional regulator
MTCPTYLNRLRQRGYRITPQREMIIESLAHAGGHVTAEALYAQVHQRSSAVNLATVYRTLEMLINEGLANRADLNGGQIVYTTEQHGLHVHLVCRHCEAVIDAEHALLAPLLAQLSAQYGFIADLQHLSLPGVCPDCQGRLQKQEM